MKEFERLKAKSILRIIIVKKIDPSSIRGYGKVCSIALLSYYSIK